MTLYTTAWPFDVRSCGRPDVVGDSENVTGSSAPTDTRLASVPLARERLRLPVNVRVANALRVVQRVLVNLLRHGPAICTGMSFSTLIVNAPVEHDEVIVRVGRNNHRRQVDRQQPSLLSLVPSRGPAGPKA